MSKARVHMGESALPQNPETLEQFEALLAYLKQSRGFDFTAYKRSSLMRRVLVRMQMIDVKDFAAYLDFLQVDPDEFTRLFNTILINVTSFFRDPPTWEYVRDELLPRLVGPPGSAAPIRIWSAGCASGEEAYSIAMLLAESIGVGAFRERVKIYATDVDEEALNQARHAVYTTRVMDDVPAPLIDKYFERQDENYLFSKELRRSVIFGRHDLIQDAPISRVDLLICRNCLMYFNSDAQAHILGRFHFALVPGGALLLGKAETLLSQSDTFDPLDVKRRLFVKAERSQEPRHLTFNSGGAQNGTLHLLGSAAEAAPVAQLLVDQDGKVVHANQQVRRLFALSSRDLGRPLQDLELSYRPFELRSSLERAYTERRPIGATEARWTGPNGEILFLELQVIPLLDGSGAPVGASILFNDVTRPRRLQEEVERATQELETALEELQSTNEELETMNEELQSTNEELQTINDEARERGDQLGELNAFLESILTSLRSAVAVVDRDLHVRKWSRRAEDMWGLRSDEVLKKNFLNLDIGLPVDRLRAPIRACLANESESLEVSLDATNRRGRPVQVRVSCAPLRGNASGEARGVILLMEETDGRA